MLNGKSSVDAEGKDEDEKNQSANEKLQSAIAMFEKEFAVPVKVIRPNYALDLWSDVAQGRFENVKIAVEQRLNSRKNGRPWSNPESEDEFICRLFSVVGYCPNIDIVKLFLEKSELAKRGSLLDKFCIDEQAIHVALEQAEGWELEENTKLIRERFIKKDLAPAVLTPMFDSLKIKEDEVSETKTISDQNKSTEHIPGLK
jgi:hypothetical protein